MENKMFSPIEKADEKGLFAVEINTRWLSNESRMALLDVIRKHSGGTELRLYLRSPETGFRIQFRSRKFGVNVCEELLSDLEKIGVTVYPKGLVPTLA